MKIIKIASNNSVCKGLDYYEENKSIDTCKIYPIPKSKIVLFLE